MTQEEQKFLADYHLEDYPRPSVTADIVTFSMHTRQNSSYRCEPEKKLCILLIQRKNPPFQHCWALPGGFMQPDETIEICAGRELYEETGAEVEVLRHVGVFSKPGRDPRGWIISNTFFSVLSQKTLQSMKIEGRDDAACAKWFDLQLKKVQDHEELILTNGEIRLFSRLKEKKNQFDMRELIITESGGLAFDHAKMIASAVHCLRDEVRNFRLLFDFLPDQFTLTELQKAQQMITDEPVLSANFRRKAANYVRKTEAFSTGAGHRPARLYCPKK